MERQEQRTPASDASIPATRRSILKVTGTTVAGAGGLTATSTSASAFSHEVDTIQIDDSGWFGDWSTDGRLPVVDELFVFIHGWFGNATATSQANSVLGSLESGGYDPDGAVALEWPATTLNYFAAERSTEDVGEVTASLLEDFYDDGGGAVRLVGHSLGGRCVLWTPTKLGSGYEIETVASLGAAASGSEVCGDPWNDGLSNACEVRNYHSRNDSTVSSAYGGLGGNALGADGAGCDPAPNYRDVDVTGSVASHTGFLGDSTVGADLADAILGGDCGRGDGGNGDDVGGGDNDASDDDTDIGWWWWWS